MEDLIQTHIPELTNLRKELHRHPELSGMEKKTAETIKQTLMPLQPDEVIENLGGDDKYSLAFIFEGAQPGPTVMLRCELDALPIQEVNTFAHCSTVDMVSHKCGHDGHMSIMVGMAHLLAAQRPPRGRVVLLFQSAEETGEGAQWVVDDPRFQALAPDWVFALHNLPHYPQGQIIYRPGAMTCASRGMKLTLKGKTSHAAWPEHGNSPAIAMCRVLEGLSLLPASADLLGTFNLVTPIHARLGEVAFGTSPGEAELYVTMRSDSAKGMRYLVEQSQELARQWVTIHGLEPEIEWSDIFALGNNAPEACAYVVQAAQDTHLEIHVLEEAIRASEDFGVFTENYTGALFGIGSGLSCPQLHNPDYDFPDMIIEQGVKMFWNILQRVYAG